MSTSSETRSPCRKAMMLMARRAPGDGCDGGRRGSSSFPPGGGSVFRRDRQPCFCLLSAVLKPLFTLRKLTTRYLSLRSAGFPARREHNLLQKGLSVKSFFGGISALSQQVILQMAAGDTTVGSRPRLAELPHETYCALSFRDVCGSLKSLPIP